MVDFAQHRQARRVRKFRGRIGWTFLIAALRH
jgi:hypothetical protein